MSSVVDYNQKLLSPHLLANNFKKDRFYFVKGQGWYYYSREGIKGPFADKESAVANLSNLIMDQSQCS